MYQSIASIFSWKRISVYLKKHCELFAILYILWYLLKHMLCVYYLQNNDPNVRGWWQFPLSDGWNVNKKIPKYGSYLNSSVPFEFKVKGKITQDYVQLPKQSRNENSGKEKIILFSHPPSSELISYPVDAKKCGGSCVVSYNTTLFYQAEAIVFYFTDPNPIPRRKFQRQLYAWMSLESPASTIIHARRYHPRARKELGDEENIFNITMTYRRDSDIYFPYFTLHEIREKIRTIEEVENIDLLLKSKDKLAVWTSSNCWFTKGGIFRLRLMINFLVLGLDIDIFGDCVNNRLPGSWENLPEQIRRYKFYFSFENSLHCRDYITEKVWWNALLAGAVPVIWGPMKKDVEAVLPKGSYIFVEEYATPQELIDYLNYLDSNSNVYRQFFNWRSIAVPERIPGRLGGEESWKTSEIVGFCQLCHMLYDDERYEKEHGLRPRRVVQSLTSWWYEEETKTCLTPMNSTEISFSYVYKLVLNHQYKMHSVAYYNYYFIAYIVVLLFLLNRRCLCEIAIRAKSGLHQTFVKRR